MEKLSHRRRQLLLYLGLGVVGAGAATALGVGSRKAGSNASIAASDSSPLSNVAPEVASTGSALAAASRGLPDFQGISQWLNSAPLTVGNLKGSVVLVQFWTFACINCQRTLPYIVQWHQQYAAKGLKVIGIHTPEFAFERDLNNVKQALQKHQITYPVPIDNEFKTWRAYNNEYWPHLFLADRQGLVRYDHIGEGAYDTTEQTIRKLLG
ncbi:thioredoxin family protein [Stenomitos frigidus]|uniref:Redoxin n=1 Tax=Stenomitos frigidus ULC18 TaxID=2107698 RepID=A0A2T1DV43_9CYAN|nr:thioredoxin family protein [Stenomitos frigidus]PSB24383.1 redoxin [Stenomitos frigidus ULC18]